MEISRKTSAVRLKPYKNRRDFRKSPEPRLYTPHKERSNIFVIQKHDAARLHYDFRLEVDGVLVSWAIPKGISDVPNEKHLAIRTEDHPLEYADFEGAIPEGQYGAGTVEIWDKGTYQLLELKGARQALKNGALKFILKGQKSKGVYALVRIRELKNSGKEQWLIFRIADK